MATPEFLADVNTTIDIYEHAIGGAAARTRQMIESYGACAALAKLVQNPDLQQGFKVLRDKGELDKTFEAIIVNHAHLFSDDIVAAAQWRLDNAYNLL